MPSPFKGNPGAEEQLEIRKYKVLINQKHWIMPCVMYTACDGRKNFRVLIMGSHREERNPWMVNQELSLRDS